MARFLKLITSKSKVISIEEKTMKRKYYLIFAEAIISNFDLVNVFISIIE